MVLSHPKSTAEDRFNIMVDAIMTLEENGDKMAEELIKYKMR